MQYFVKTPRYTLSIIFVVLPRLAKAGVSISYSGFPESLPFLSVSDILQQVISYRLCFLRLPRTLLYANEQKTISCLKLVGLSGLEPPTSRLSGVRSNRLSYRPMQGKWVLPLWCYFRNFPTSLTIFFCECSSQRALALFDCTFKNKQHTVLIDLRNLFGFSLISFYLSVYSFFTLRYFRGQIDFLDMRRVLLYASISKNRYEPKISLERR